MCSLLNLLLQHNKPNLFQNTTAIYSSMSQQILNQNKLILNTQLNKISLSKHFDFKDAHSIKIVAENIENNFHILQSSITDLKHRGDLMLNILKYEPVKTQNHESNPLWNKIKKCSCDLINEFKVLNKIKIDYIDRITKLQLIMTECKHNDSLKGLAKSMEQLNLCEDWFDAKLSQLPKKGFESLDKAATYFMGTEAAKQLEYDIARNHGSYVQNENELDAMSQIIAYQTKQIDQNIKLKSYLCNELYKAKTKLMQLKRQLTTAQSHTTTGNRITYQKTMLDVSYCPISNCVKCNHNVFSKDNYLIELENGDVLHNSCFQCYECRELLTEITNKYVYTNDEHNAQIYCSQVCVNELNNIIVNILTEEYNCWKDIELQIQESVNATNGMHDELKQDQILCNEDWIEKKQTSQILKEKLQQSVDNLDNVVTKTGVNAKDLTDFASNTSEILLSMLDSYRTQKLLNSGISTANKMIDKHFGGGGKKRIDKFICNSSEFKDVLGKFVHQLNSLGFIYMSQLQCKGNRKQFIQNIVTRLNHDIKWKYEIKKLEITQNVKNALRRLSRRHWKKEDKMRKKYTEKQAFIFADYLKQLIAKLSMYENIIDNNNELTKTYGITMSYDINVAKAKNIPSEYIESHKYYNHKIGKWMVMDCFHVLAHKGSKISTDDAYIAVGNGIETELLCSDMKDPKVKINGRVVAKYKNYNVKYSDRGNNKLIPVVNEFRFYETTIEGCNYLYNSPHVGDKFILNYDAASDTYYVKIGSSINMILASSF
eukprot:258014_1